MRQAVIAGMALALLAAPALFAEDIKFIYGVSVTGGSFYKVGDIVNWSVSATVSGGRGIAGFGVSLIESKGEAMTTLPINSNVATNLIDLSFCSNFMSGGMPYGFFTKYNYFTVGGGGGNGSVSLSASQYLGPKSKIFYKALDKFGGALCEGTITLTKSGFHSLYAVHGGGSVWIDDLGNSESVGRSSGGETAFYVTATENANLGNVNLSLLSKISSSLGQADCSPANHFAEGVDVNQDGRVDGEDLQLLFDQGGANIDVAADLYQGGDLTEDERVNLRDFAVLAAQWQRTDAQRANLWCHGADFDRSGTVDFHDLAYLADHWLKPGDPNAR